MSTTLHIVVPRYTEQRIRDLCAAAAASANDADAIPLIQELREALREHIQLVRESLADRAVVLTILHPTMEE